MLEKTMFKSDEEIKEYLHKVYNLDINDVAKINRGSANIYFLNKSTYVLKEIKYKYNFDKIIKEIEVINHLKKKGISVPNYVKTSSGDYYTIYKDIIIIIQDFIEGYTINNNEGNYDQVIECAKEYGVIVNALKDLKIKLPLSNISEWYSEERFEQSINKYNKLLTMLNDNEIDNNIKNDILEKMSMINSIKSKINFNNMNNLTILNTHGDFSVEQLIYKDGKINSVIDFVSACRMPIVWELIRSYSYIDKEAVDGEFNLDTFINYVKEFNKYIKLNKYDIEYMPYIYLIQLLNSDYGYKQYINDNSKMNLLAFGCFRTNVCRYLFKNAKVISERLLS